MALILYSFSFSLLFAESHISSGQTVSTIQCLFLAMALYPEVQKKAQEELDRVVGPNRLPDFSDYDDLVYIQAVTLEAMRWMVVVPLGVSHRVIADDEYMGYFIPKGTVVVAVSEMSTR